MKIFPAALTLTAAAAAIALGAAPPPSAAAQDDPRLDALFAELQLNLERARAREVTRQIWRLWTENDDTEVTARMADAARAMSQQRFGGALRQLDRVVTLAPEFAEGWNRRATVHYMMGEYERSIADVKKTLQLEPRHFGALSGLGLIHIALEQYAAALIALENALRHNPHLDGVKQNIEFVTRKLYGDPT